MIKHVYTLAEIKARHKELAERVARSEASIRDQWNELTAPPVVDTPVQLWVNRAQAAYSIYDGLMSGYKLFRHYRGFFKRKK